MYGAGDVWQDGPVAACILGHGLATVLEKVVFIFERLAKI